MSKKLKIELDNVALQFNSLILQFAEKAGCNIKEELHEFIIPPSIPVPLIGEDVNDIIFCKKNLEQIIDRM